MEEIYGGCKLNYFALHLQKLFIIRHVRWPWRFQSYYIGPEVALFVQKHLPEQLEINKNFQVGNFESALKETYLLLDKMLEAESGK
jgi:hypothetical protein